MPGQTTWTEAEHFLAAFASRIDETRSTKNSSRFFNEVYFKVPEEFRRGSIVQHNYDVANDIIQLIRPDTGNARSYSLSQLLTALGQPTEVLVRTYSKPREGELPFFLVLFYPTQGIMAMYVDNADKLVNEIHGCFESGALLWLWSPDVRKWTVEELAPLGIEDTNTLRPLEEVTGMDLDTFYKTFESSNTSTCVDTPAKYWSSH